MLVSRTSCSVLSEEPAGPSKVHTTSDRAGFAPELLPVELDADDELLGLAREQGTCAPVHGCPGERMLADPSLPHWPTISLPVAGTAH
jgi:hypothetical protein